MDPLTEFMFVLWAVVNTFLMFNLVISIGEITEVLNEEDNNE